MYLRAPLRPMPAFRDTFGDRRPADTSKPPDHHHGGVDLRASQGQEVYAPFSGYLFTMGWSASNRAVLIQGDNGMTVILGGLIPAVDNETLVHAGELVGFAEAYPMGDVMVHVELTNKLVRDSLRWEWGGESPPHMVNPTKLLRLTQESEALLAGGKEPLRDVPETGSMTPTVPPVAPGRRGGGGVSYGGGSIAAALGFALVAAMLLSLARKGARR